jgi:hypothetical protein
LVALDGEKHELILRFVVQELETARDIERHPAARGWRGVAPHQGL